MIKYFRLDYDYILWGISYTNFVMLQATIPVYDSDDDDGKNVQVSGSDEDGLDDLDNFLKRK